MGKFKKYTVSLLILLCLFTTYGFSQEGHFNRIYLEQMIIMGTSNITNFKLSFAEDDPAQNNDIVGVQGDNGMVFYIPVEYITARNKFMLNDFRHLINAQDYPYIKLTIDNGQLEMLNGNLIANRIKVKVTLSGMSKIYSIPFYKNCSGGNNSYITGNTNLNLSDFNIDASKKIFGFVRLDDKVFINFKINFSQS